SVELAEGTKLKTGTDALVYGEIINETEDRKVLHTDVRKESEKQTTEVAAALKQMQQFCENIINGTLKGSIGRAFTDVVNIGIGGSDLGPKLVTEALADYKNHLNVHYISNIDNDSIQCLKTKLQAETTLVIIVSKSFTTLETISNADIFKNWLLQNGIKTQDQDRKSDG